MANEVASVLNDLIETSKDGEQGFRKAAEETKDVELKALFASRAQDCATAVSALQAEVTRLGEKPETSGSVTGALHRGWLQVKATVTSQDDHSILSEVERGEDAAKKNYREALDKELPADVRALVEKQYQGVLQNHNVIRDLRDKLAARS
ncbi:MAG: PA2169 family four-helix-bundle protein [Janthinobacterium lividum]